jgi:hypothetical protein
MPIGWARHFNNGSASTKARAALRPGRLDAGWCDFTAK